VEDGDPKDVVHGVIWCQVASRFAHDVSDLQLVVEFLGDIWVRNDLVMAKHGGRCALEVAGALVYGADRLGFGNIFEVVFNVRSKSQAVSNHRWVDGGAPLHVNNRSRRIIGGCQRIMCDVQERVSNGDRIGQACRKGVQSKLAGSFCGGTAALQDQCICSSKVDDAVIFWFDSYGAQLFSVRGGYGNSS